MRKACHLFKSLLLPTLKTCPLYHLRISHLVILLITLWVFIFTVWPHGIDIYPISLETSADMVAHTLMDVDPSPTTAETLPATTLDSEPVVCLPYSLVPSLDPTSQSYQKAVMTLGKQQAVPDSVAKCISLILVLDGGSTPLFPLIILPNSVNF